MLSASEILMPLVPAGSYFCTAGLSVLNDTGFHRPASPCASPDTRWYTNVPTDVGPPVAFLSISSVIVFPSAEIRIRLVVSVFPVPSDNTRSNVLELSCFHAIVLLLVSTLWGLPSNT